MTDTSLDRMVFESPTWRSSFDGAYGSVTCLTGSHRQARDSALQEVLESVRWGRAGENIITRINNTWASSAFDGPVTKMRIKKSAVLSINTSMLGTIQFEEHVFDAVDVAVDASALAGQDVTAALRALVDSTLSLKESAVVILTRKVAGVPPGSRGVVRKIDCSDMVIDGQAQRVRRVTCVFSEKEVEVTPARFSVFDSVGREAAYCEQLPLLLGWAITVHRAQGLTLDAVEIDFNLDTWSTCGLVYTALSRVRSLSSLRLRGLRRDLIRVSRFALRYYEKKLIESGMDPTDDGRPPMVA